MEKSVERAQKMIHDLLHGGLMIKDVVSGTGVNPTTLGWIRKGRVVKIAERTFDRIWDFWSENAPPRDEREAAREVPEPPVETPQEAATVKTTKTPARRQKRPEKTYEGIVSRQYVPVDLTALTTVIDGIIDSFEAAKEELEGIREEIG